MDIFKDITVLKGNTPISTETYNEWLVTIKAIIYVRVSTEKQVDNTSLDDQVYYCVRKLKEDHNLDDDQMLVFREEGRMGDDVSRPALNQALTFMDNGMGDYFICYDQDRLARNSLQLMQWAERIWSKAVQLLLVTGKVDQNDEESVFFFKLKGLFDEYIKKKILKNSRRGRLAKARKGLLPSFRRLYGYTYNSETSKLEINENEKAVLLKMKNWLLKDNFSVNKITSEVAKYHDAPDGDIWYTTTVSRMLKNYDYTGVYHWGTTEVIQDQGKKKQVATEEDSWIKIPIPPMWSEDEYNEILKAIEKNSKNKGGRPSTDYLLRGKIKCGKCGSSAGSGVQKKLKDYTLKYYSCQGKKARSYKANSGSPNVKCNVSKNWRQDIVDDKVWEWLLSVIENPQNVINSLLEEQDDVSQQNDVTKELEFIENEIGKLKSKKKNFTSQQAEGLLSMDELKEYVFPINEKIENYEEEKIFVLAKLDALKDKTDEIELMKKMLSDYNERLKHNDSLTMEIKREAVDTFIKKVVVHEDDKIDIYANFDYDNNNDDKTKDEKENSSVFLSNGYENHNNVQEHGYTFHTNTTLTLPPASEVNMIHKQWEIHLDKWDQVEQMYLVGLKSITQIAEKLNLPYDAIKVLIQKKIGKVYSKEERCKMLRERVFESLYKYRYKYKMTYKEIYAKYGYNQQFVKQAFEERNVDPLNFNKSMADNNEYWFESFVTEKDEKDIVKKYKKGIDVSKLAEEYSYKSPQSIREILKKHGVDIVNKNHLSDKQEKEIIALYNKGIGTTAIAKHLGIGIATAYRALKRNGIETKMTPKKRMEKIHNGEIEAPYYNRFLKMKQNGFQLDIEQINFDEMYNLYVEENIPNNYIAELFNCSNSKIYNVRDAFKIKKINNKDKLKQLVKN